MAPLPKFPSSRLVEYRAGLGGRCSVLTSSRLARVGKGYAEDGCRVAG